MTYSTKFRFIGATRSAGALLLGLAIALPGWACRPLTPPALPAAAGEDCALRRSAALVEDPPARVSLPVADPELLEAAKAAADGREQEPYRKKLSWPLDFPSKGLLSFGKWQSAGGHALGLYATFPVSAAP